MKNIGIGIDYQHRNSYEITFEELITNLIDCLSHLSIVGLTNEREVQKFLSLSKKTPIIHHLTNIAPAGVEGLNIVELEKQYNFTKKLKARWCVEDIGIWNIGPYNIPYFSPPVLCEPVLEQTINGINLLQSKISVPFLAEVPSCSFVAGNMDLGIFFQNLVKETNCSIVLDVSHIYSYAIYCDESCVDILKRFPLSSVKEIHIAGGSVHPIHKWRYRDTHNEPIMSEILELLKISIKQCPSLQAITYEIGIGSPIYLIQDEITLLNNICDELYFTPNF